MRIGGEVPGGGSNLLGGSKAMSEYGMPLPRIVNASPRLMVRRRLPIFKYFFSPAQAARKATPCLRCNFRDTRMSRNVGC